MLPEVLQTKILLYNIHPVAEMYKKQLARLGSRMRKHVQSYRPTMFRKCRLGCWQCHRIHSYQLFEKGSLDCPECNLKEKIELFNFATQII